MSEIITTPLVSVRLLTTTMINPIGEQQQAHGAQQAFEAFFSRWLIRQEQYLRELTELMELGDGGDTEENIERRRCEEMVERVMDHYGEYFQEKERVIRANVFLVMTPTWLSSSERGYLWLGGYRPGLAFRLVLSNVGDLSEDQSQRINRLMAEVREEETSLTDEFTRVQESIASPAMVELARQLGCPRNGAARDMESAIERLRESMETLVRCADILRTAIGVKIVEMLSPSQAVRFLAAATQLQVRLRRWGAERDARFRRMSPIVSENGAA